MWRPACICLSVRKITRSFNWILVTFPGPRKSSLKWASLIFQSYRNFLNPDFKFGFFITARWRAALSGCFSTFILSYKQWKKGLFQSEKGWMVPAGMYPVKYRQRGDEVITVLLPSSTFICPLSPCCLLACCPLSLHPCICFLRKCLNPLSLASGAWSAKHLTRGLPLICSFLIPSIHRSVLSERTSTFSSPRPPALLCAFQLHVLLAWLGGESVKLWFHHVVRCTSAGSADQRASRL